MHFTESAVHDVALLDIHANTAASKPSADVWPKFMQRMHWETFLIYVINLSKLNVTVDMSNIMGHTE